MPFTVLHTFPTNAQGRGMAFKGSFLWLAVLQINFPPPTGSLEQIDKTTGAVTDHSSGVASSLAFQAVYDAAHDQFWTSPAGGGAIHALGLFDGTGTLLSNPTNPAASNPYGMCVTPTHLWVGNSGSTSFSVYNIITGALIATVAAPTFGPTGGIGTLIYDGSSVWCAYPSNELVQLSDVGMIVLNDFAVAGVTGFGGIILAGANLWATDRVSNQLYKLDLLGNVVSTFPMTVSGQPGPLAFDGTFLWALDFGGGVGVYDLTGAFLGLAGIAGSAQWIACDGTPAEAWVSMGGPDQVENFLFTPLGGGHFEGTHVGFFGAGKVGGGTK
jgi:hypothetical protein